MTELEKSLKSIMSMVLNISLLTTVPRTISIIAFSHLGSLVCFLYAIIDRVSRKCTLKIKYVKDFGVPLFKLKLIPLRN